MAVILSEHDLAGQDFLRNKRCSICAKEILAYAYPVVFWQGKGSLVICRYCIGIAPGLMCDLVHAQAICRMHEIQPKYSSITLKRIFTNELKKEWQREAAEEERSAAQQRLRVVEGE